MRANDIPEEDRRDYYWSAVTQPSETSSPETLRLALPRNVAMLGFGVNETGEAVFLDYASAIQRYGKTGSRTFADCATLQKPKSLKLGKEVREGEVWQLV